MKSRLSSESWKRMYQTGISIDCTRERCIIENTCLPVSEASYQRMDLLIQRLSDFFSSDLHQAQGSHIYEDRLYRVFCQSIAKML